MLTFSSNYSVSELWLLPTCVLRVRNGQIPLIYYFFALDFRGKQSGQMEVHEGSCKPCPVAASSPVCGSDGHNYASEVKAPTQHNCFIYFCFITKNMHHKNPEKKWKMDVTSF